MTQYPWMGSLKRIAQRVRQMHDAGQPVHIRAMQAWGEPRDLYQHALTKAKWDDVLKKAGLDPNQIRTWVPGEDPETAKRYLLKKTKE